MIFIFVFWENYQYTESVSPQSAGIPHVGLYSNGIPIDIVLYPGSEFVNSVIPKLIPFPCSSPVFISHSFLDTIIPDFIVSDILLNLSHLFPSDVLTRTHAHVGGGEWLLAYGIVLVVEKLGPVHAPTVVRLGIRHFGGWRRQLQILAYFVDVCRYF